MAEEVRNGHYLDKFGCSFGQVNRARMEEIERSVKKVEKEVKSVNSRLGWLLVTLISNLIATLAYILTHWRPGP